jgi:hypothetical protein
MVRLRGAEPATGRTQPGVAFSIVQPGLTLEGIAKAPEFEEGPELLDRNPQDPAREIGSIGR